MSESDAYALAYEIMRPLEGRCEAHLLQQLADRIVNNLRGFLAACDRAGHIRFMPDGGVTISRQACRDPAS